MTDQIYLWLLPVLALGSFLLGGYLLVTNRQAKAAGAESNKIKFLGVEIESSTSGTTLVALAVVVVAVVIAMGVGNANDDGDGRADDDKTSETATDPTTTGHTGSTGTSTHTSNPNPSGLERDDLISAHDLDDAVEGYGLTDWDDVTAEDRPVLDCQQRSMPNIDGFVKKPVKANFKGSSEYGSADAMTSAAKFDSESRAESVFRDVTTWLETCPGGLENSTPLDSNQAGDLMDDGDLAWRSFWLSAEPGSCGGSCIWVDSQGVALVDDHILLVSVRWFTEQDPSTVSDPMPDLLPVVVDQLR